MSRFSKIAVGTLLGTSLALTACAPKDSKLGTNGGGAGAPGQNTNRGDLGVQALAERDLEYTRHLVSQIAEVRRMVDTALNLELGRRTTTAEGDKKVQLGPANGCRSLLKVSPLRDVKVAVFNEKFRISYEKCADKSDGVKSAEKSGTELFHLAYALPFPKKDDVDKSVGLPTSIIVDAPDLLHDIRIGQYDTIKIARGISLNAEIIEENETSLTYNVYFNERTRFDYNVFKTIRSGSLKATLSSLRIEVAKASRTVTGISFAQASDGNSGGRMTLSLEGEQWDKSDKNTKIAQLSNRQFITLKDLTVTTSAPLVLPAGHCGAPEGTFVVKRGERDEAVETSFVVAGGKIQATGEGSVPSAVTVCVNEQGDPAFSEQLETMFR